MASFYLTNTGARKPQTVRVVREDVFTLNRNTPSFNAMMPPGGAFPAHFGSANAGLRSTARGGVRHRLLWHIESPLSFPESIVVGPNERILYLCSNGTGRGSQIFVSCDAQGKELWQMPLEVSFGSACWLQNGNTLLFGTTQSAFNDKSENTSSLAMINPEGKEMWRWNRFSEEGGGNLLQTTPDGQVMMHTGSSIFSWKSNGQLLWRIPAPASFGHANFASSAKGHIFGVGRGRTSGGIYCLDRTGRFLFQKGNVNVSSRGVVDEAGNLRVVTYKMQGTQIEYTLRCLTPMGEELWHSPVLNFDKHSPNLEVNLALTHYGRTLVQGVNQVLCLDKRGGRVWQTQIGLPSENPYNYLFTMLASVDGYVYLNTRKGVFTLAPNGQIVDTFSLPRYNIRSFTIGERRLYLVGGNTFGATRGHIWAYDLKPPAH
jgi:outer membrane protein assembly factor BamB